MLIINGSDDNALGRRRSVQSTVSYRLSASCSTAASKAVTSGACCVLTSFLPENIITLNLISDYSENERVHSETATFASVFRFRLTEIGL